MMLRIAHRNVTVRQMVEKDVPRGKSWDGFWHAGPGIIALCPKAQPDVQANTLIHECLHAIWHTQNLPDRSDEETVVTRVADGLVQLIRDNPQFMAAVMAGIGGTRIVAPVEKKRATRVR